jgi:hypothetical protein
MEEISSEQIDRDIAAGRQNDARFVTVTIDGREEHIRPGVYVVKQLKRLLQVKPDYALDQVVSGKLEPLEEHDKVVIKGGEVFVSHVRGGAAS